MISIMKTVLRVFVFLLVAGVLVCAYGQEAGAPKNQPQPLSDALVSRLLPDYRDQAKSLVTASPELQQRWLKLSDEELTRAVISQLGRKPEAAGFLLGEFEKESSPKLRSAILSSLNDYWETHPDSQNILERHGASDADAAVALESLELLRAIRMRELDRALKTRLTTAMDHGDAAGSGKLMAEEERWISLVDGTMLPGFLREPPPVLAATPPSRDSVRWLAFGDFGTCGDDQKRVARAMVAYHREHPFDFGITTGDNFTPEGMHSVRDPRWKNCWEDLYGPMGITVYATLGNHDWVLPDSPASEILYSSASWKMPSPYYTFTAGPVQFFAIDTEEISKAQMAWLREALDTSHARWKVVYGHFHLYGASPDPNYAENKEVINTLLPILKGRADVYLSGHYHSLQHLKPVDGVNFFITAGGGRPLYPIDPHSLVALWAAHEFGFMAIEANTKEFRVRFIGADGKELYQDTLTKDVSGRVFELRGPTMARGVGSVEGLPAFGLLPVCDGESTRSGVSWLGSEERSCLDPREP
jgi:tartrate-resistant acid phosphatase type 5